MSVNTLDSRNPFTMALDSPAEVDEGGVVITAASLPCASDIAANAALIAAPVLPATSGAPVDTPADGTVRFDPATGILYVKATAGWVDTTLT